jgi:hypothetical protein
MRNRLIYGAAALVFGIIIAVLGFKEKGLADAASQEPEEISLRDLIARGPDGNPNIILTDFVLCENLVYQSGTGGWQKVWVPIVPRENPQQVSGGHPGVVQALIFTTNARNDADLIQQCNQPRLKALVTNRIASLSGQERTLLERSHSRTNFNNCLIIQEGREPAGVLKVILLIGGGSLAALIGSGTIGWAVYQWCQAPQPRKKRKKRRKLDEESDDFRPTERNRYADEPRRRSREHE